MTSYKCSLGVAFVLAGCTAVPGGRPEEVPVRQAAEVRDRSARIGIYSWGNGVGLDQARRSVTAAGARTMRVALSPADPYELGLPPASTLVEVARHPAYAALFSDPALETIMLTAYSASDMVNPWADGYDAAEYDAELAEIADLGEHLLRSYPEKTFVVLNWEGDNALDFAGAGPEGRDGFRDWIEARVTGVREASARVGGGRLFAGIEFNRVFDCDARPADRACVLTDVATAVEADFYSFSSYEALATPSEQTGASVSSALDIAYETIRAAHPETERSQIMLGEFGFPREAPGYGDCGSAGRFAATVDAALDWGVSYAIAWQWGDNMRRPGEAFFGFGAVRPDGSMTLVGEALLDLWDDGHIDDVQTQGCPDIADGGVVDALDYDDRVPPRGYVAIFGANLVGASPNELPNELPNDLPNDLVVHFAREDEHATVGPGSPHFYASQGQINAQLPDVFESGDQVLVWVTRGDGLDSDGAFVTVQ